MTAIVIFSIKLRQNLLNGQKNFWAGTPYYNINLIIPKISQNGIIFQNSTKNARGVSTEYWSAFGILLSLVRPSALSPLTVLPVVRSAPHGRRMPFPSPYNDHSSLSFLSFSSLLPFATILLSIPFPNCPSTYSAATLLFIGYTLLFFPHLSPITPTLLFLSFSYYTITTFLSSPSHSSIYNDLIH